MEKIGINIENVSKEFPLTEWDYLTAIWRIVWGKRAQLADHQKKVAVRDVSLSISSGERVGVIGRNGAGKTTLLQMIAGLAEPSSGKIAIEGRITCVMTLGIGLREELTGKENILLDGELNGKGSSEVQGMFQNIIEFADLGEFIDRPVRMYSTGMKSRLAFAMMTHIQPQILMIDEALSVGDAEFSKKAALKIKSICQSGKIVLLVSHSMATIREMCNRCIWIEEGKVMMDGDPFTVTQAYLEFIQKKGEEFMRGRNAQKHVGIMTSPEVEMTQLQLMNSEGQSRTFFDCYEEIRMRVGFLFRKKKSLGDLRIRLERLDGLMMIDRRIEGDEIFSLSETGEQKVEIAFQDLYLGKSEYEINLQWIKKESGEVLVEKCICFRVENRLYPHENPVLWQKADWKISTLDEAEVVS